MCLTYLCTSVIHTGWGDVKKLARVIYKILSLMVGVQAALLLFLLISLKSVVVDVSLTVVNILV